MLGVFDSDATSFRRRHVVPNDRKLLLRTSMPDDTAEDVADAGDVSRDTSPRLDLNRRAIVTPCLVGTV